MKYKHTKRPGFLLGFIDFFTAGLFFLIYMPLGGLQDELEEILGHRVLPYWKAYLLGVPTLFIYTLVWMARIAEELKKGGDLQLIGFASLKVVEKPAHKGINPATKAVIDIPAKKAVKFKAGAKLAL